MNQALRKHIDISALQNNISVIKNAISSNTKIMAVVKQNAYGHGLQQTIPILSQHVNSYAVATLSEAVELRKVATDKEILILSPPTEESISGYEEANASIAVSSLDHFVLLESTQQPFHVQIDTGMNRLGIKPKDAQAAAIESLKHQTRFRGVYSHFANADNPEHASNSIQIDSFNSVQKLFPEGERHLCNSDGTVNFPDSHYSMIRPGLLFWGYGSLDGLQPVMKWSTHVIQSKRIQKGDGVSYGSSFVANEDTNISILALGYGEGFSRLFSNKVFFSDGESLYPSIGNVTMDYVVIKTGNQFLEAGTELYLPNALILANTIGTIPYEMLCVMGNAAISRA